MKTFSECADIAKKAIRVLDSVSTDNHAYSALNYAGLAIKTIRNNGHGYEYFGRAGLLVRNVNSSIVEMVRKSVNLEIIHRDKQTGTLVIALPPSSIMEVGK